MRFYFGELQTFNMLDRMLNDLISYTAAVYRDSYRRKQFKIHPDHPIFPVVYRLHNVYRQTGNPITMDNVAEIITATPAEVLDRMLAYFSQHGFLPPPEQPIPSNSANRRKRFPTSNNNNHQQ